MTKIKCENMTKSRKRIRVRVIKAPLVDTNQLKEIIFARARAVVL